MQPLAGRLVPLLGVTSLLLLFATSTAGKKAEADTEIVRLSRVEGDVRISEGKSGKVELKTDWGAAVNGLPIDEGFTIATGSGRAEIEFESGWTLYLADNSTLEFQTLMVYDDAPQTSVALLTGTLSVYFKPAPGETLLVTTPAGQQSLLETAGALRIESYLDAMSMTALENNAVMVETGRGEDLSLAKGQTAYSRAEQIDFGGLKSGAPEGWNSWVSARVSKRDAALSAGLKASGLDAPIPGLADLYISGKFFDCEPYGRCWEPNADPLEGVLQTRSPEVAAPETASESGGGRASQNVVGGQQTVWPNRARYEIYTRRIPGSNCSGETIERVQRNLDTGEERVLLSMDTQPSWRVATCHAGSYAYSHKRGYVWVVGKKHHHPPCHWIKFHGQHGYVPRSPLDVKGKPPANLKHGVVFASSRLPGHYELTKVKPGEKVTTLSSAPKEFLHEARPQLLPAARPQIQAHLMFETAGRSEKTPPITYDFGRQSFVLASAPGWHSTATVTIVQMNSRGEFKPSGGAWTGQGNRVSGRSEQSGDRASGRESGSGSGRSGSGGSNHASGRDSGHATGGGSGPSSGGGSGGYSGGGGSGHSSGGSGGGGYSGGGGGSSGGGSGGSRESGGGGSSSGGGVRPR
jgi:hypothetical protein